MQFKYGACRNCFRAKPRDRAQPPLGDRVRGDGGRELFERKTVNTEKSGAGIRTNEFVGCRARGRKYHNLAVGDPAPERPPALSE